MQTICHSLKTILKVRKGNTALSFCASLWSVHLPALFLVALLFSALFGPALLAPAFFFPGQCKTVWAAQAAQSDSSTTEPNAAPEPPTSVSDAGKLEEILRKSLTALGGEEAIAKMAANFCVFGKEFDDVGDLEKAQSSQLDALKGAGASSYRLLRKGAKWRFDHERAGGASGAAGTSGESGVNNWTEGFNGEAAWVQASGKTEDAVMDTAKLLNFESTLPASFLLEAARSLGGQGSGSDLQVTLDGKAKFHDSQCYQIVFSSAAAGESFTLYVEEKSYTVEGLSFKLGGGDNAHGGSRDIEILYLEYRPVAGSLYPYKKVRMVGTAAQHVYVVSDINTNQVPNDHDFDRPGGSFKLSKTIVIPFDYAQKELLVKGRLNNGEEMDFLFDTGASDTIIDRRVAAESFLLKEGTADMRVLAGQVTTNTSTIGRLEIGNLIVNDIEAKILDLSSQSRHLGRRLGGIIGINVISKFVVTIDYGKSTLTINDADSFVRPEDALAVTFLQKSAPVVKVKLMGKDDVNMLVDTGAAFNNLPAAVASHYAVEGSGRHTVEGEGLGGRSVRLGKVTVDSVAIAGRPVRKVEFTYTLPDAAAAAVSKGNDPGKQESGGFFQTGNSLGILGNPFWENFLVIIDYKFQRMLLKPSSVLRVRSDIEKSIESGDRALIERREFRGAEAGYQRALAIALANGDKKNEARVFGRIGILRRVMAKDLNRPEHSKAAYDYFVKAQELAKKVGATEIEGRILADWSLLYLDNGQAENAIQTMDRALILAPQDPDVNVDCAVHLSHARRYPEMQRYIERALFLDPSNWQALWFQVKLSETFADTAKMISTLKEIVRYFPWSKVAQDKLRIYEPAAVPAPASNAAPPAVRSGAQPQAVLH
jgi:predicted aspartyl protease